jgi:hypothetical protein
MCPLAASTSELPGAIVPVDQAEVLADFSKSAYYGAPLGDQQAAAVGIGDEGSPERSQLPGGQCLLPHRQPCLPRNDESAGDGLGPAIDRRGRQRGYLKFLPRAAMLPIIMKSMTPPMTIPAPTKVRAWVSDELPEVNCKMIPAHRAAKPGISRPMLTVHLDPTARLTAFP